MELTEDINLKKKLKSKIIFRRIAFLIFIVATVTYLAGGFFPN